MRRSVLALTILATLSAHARAAEPFRIGVVEDLSGTYSGNGGPNSVLATKMAVEDFGGTVLGRPIEVIAVDHQTKPDLGVSLTRQLIDQSHVSMVNIGGSSGVGLAVQNVTREAKILSIQSGNYAASIAGKSCSPYGTQWAVSTTALARAVANALLSAGAKTWFIIEADYAFGHDLANDVQQTVQAGGGRVVGRTSHPLATTDMSSPLLQAQTSHADIIAFANAGPDLVNSVKQAKEFGITNTAALLVFINNVVAMGLDTAQGLRFPVSFYWDSNEP
ncbi:MAG: ABC transporter substrate-binding protein, partial [Pseudomonadota bacterium]|nr:ABC transporter substrate-binding protein [Pseudomonadota bacterium]